MEKQKVFIVLEEYSNDGEIQVNVISTNSTFEKAQKSMKKKFKDYKSSGVFEKGDIKNAEIDDNSIFVFSSCDDYYGKLDIVEQEID